MRNREAPPGVARARIHGRRTPLFCDASAAAAVPAGNRSKQGTPAPGRSTSAPSCPRWVNKQQRDRSRLARARLGVVDEEDLLGDVVQNKVIAGQLRPNRPYRVVVIGPRLRRPRELVLVLGVVEAGESRDLVDQPVARLPGTAIVQPVVDLRGGEERPVLVVAITRCPRTVLIHVGLIGVAIGGTVVANVADVVAVGIGLIRIGDHDAVVGCAGVRRKAGLLRTLDLTGSCSAFTNSSSLSI